jgi:hypothetical protein
MSVSTLADRRSVATIAAVLREQRKLAIQNCDFPKAKIIAIQLKQLNAQSNDSLASQQLLQNQNEYDKVKEAVRAEASRAYSAALEQTYSIESEFQGRLAILVSTHAEQLAAHASSLAGELELSSIRGVPDSRVMINEAQTIAKFGDFDRAQSLYEESASVHEATILARHAEIRDVYERLQRQLQERHDEELRLNHQKKLSKVSEVTMIYRRAVDKLRKQLANASFKFQVRQGEDEAELFPEIAPVEQELLIPGEGEPKSQTTPESASPKGNSSACPRGKWPRRSPSSISPRFSARVRR